MSIFDSFKMFRDKSVDVTCPKCSRIAEQSMHKLRKNITMVCPHCGYYFRGVEDC
ncbi:YnfU family zinc-binding protein [Limnobaculum eriocheiris]|nr:YnfU family zinc-binding protein [Limnobaculum eriocheiris]